MPQNWLKISKEGIHMRERRTDTKGRRKNARQWGEDSSQQTPNHPQSFLLLQTFIFTMKTLEENAELHKKLEGFEKLREENASLRAQLFEKLDHTFTKRFALFIFFIAFVLPVLIGVGYEIFQYSIHNLSPTLIQATTRLFSKITP